MDALLEIEDLKKYYGKEPNQTKALNGITFQVMPGEFLGIMGSSGSGKSTLLNCIATVIQPDSGKIRMKGTEIQRLKGKKLAGYRGKEIGYLFQNFELLDNLTGRENIMVPLSIHNISEAEGGKRLEQLAEYLEITEVLDKFPSQMSGGQKQRLSIARVFLKNPPILIFDEATSALDNESEQIVQESLEKLAKNRTTFVIAHRLTTIENAEEIFMLTDEGIKERGTHKELMELDGEYAHMVKIHSAN